MPPTNHASDCVYALLCAVRKLDNGAQTAPPGSASATIGCRCGHQPRRFENLLHIMTQKRTYGAVAVEWRAHAVFDCSRPSREKNASPSLAAAQALHIVP